MKKQKPLIITAGVFLVALCFAILDSNLNKSPGKPERAIIIYTPTDLSADTSLLQQQ